MMTAMRENVTKEIDYEKMTEFIRAVISVSRNFDCDQDTLSDALMFMSGTPVEMTFRLSKMISRLKKAYELFLSGAPRAEVKQAIKKALYRNLSNRKKTYSYIDSVDDEENYQNYVEHLMYVNGIYYDPFEYDDTGYPEAENDKIDNYDLLALIDSNNINNLSKLSSRTVDKIIKSIKNIALSKVSDMPIGKQIELANACLNVLFSKHDIETIEMIINKRSTEYYYISLWASIRMNWGSLVKKSRNNQPLKVRFNKNKYRKNLV